MEAGHFFLCEAPYGKQAIQRRLIPPDKTTPLIPVEGDCNPLPGEAFLIQDIFQGKVVDILPQLLHIKHLHNADPLLLLCWS